MAPLCATEVTRDLLQRSDHRSHQALEKDLRNWVKAWNENPKPFIWTKTADQILESLGRLLQRTNPQSTDGLGGVRRVGRAEVLV